MLLSTRKNEPAHYMLKIESFSVLSEAGTIKVESDVFEASGHKWRLEFYPNGNEQEEGGNHISLYLVICDSESVLKGLDVCFDVNFFVYDHIRHNYVTFQNDEGNRTRFHEKHTEWGFAKLISLDHFKESSRGYLFDDSCVYGVEVFAVPEFTLNDRCLSMIKPPQTMNTYSWTVDKFSAVKVKFLTSEVFKVGKVKWTLSLYPKGNKSVAGEYLAIYVKVHEAENLPDGWRVYAEYELRLKNQCGHADKVLEFNHWFCKSEADWGSSGFVAFE